VGKIQQVGVIGAGASGFFAAIYASMGGSQVTILEKTSKSLAKVAISGGGRCNVTHHAPEVAKLVKNYPRGEKFLKKVFSQFSVKDTIDWFESRGVELKVEPDGRMFPKSDSSQSIINALLIESEKQNVAIKYNFGVERISKEPDGFKVYAKNHSLHFDKLIICTGGHPQSGGFRHIQELGHRIAPPIPSLFTFNTPNEPIRELMGIAVPDALVRLEGTKLSYRGPLLITHWGLSGPAVLKLSAFGAEWLHQKGYQTNVHIRWVHDLDEQDTISHLNTFKLKHPKKKVRSNPLFGLPARLWEHLVEKSEIREELLWQDLPKKQFNKLVQHVFCYNVTLQGKTTYKEEFVTAGGVLLEEINSETMESRLISGLYFAGEVTNLDGITGGFNFQAAWSTGYLAGKSVNIDK
jgi:predicted Rossmann fold flavoprotein